MVAEAAPGAADVADDLALGDGARGDRKRGLMGVTRREAAAVVDAGVVAVAAGRGRQRDRARLRGADRGTGGDGDVDALVHPAPAHAERRDDGAVDRPDE